MRPSKPGFSEVAIYDQYSNCLWDSTTGLQAYAVAQAIKEHDWLYYNVFVNPMTNWKMRLFRRFLKYLMK